MTHYYISFATDTEFLGATVIEASTPSAALALATSKGLNPGGEAAILKIPRNADPNDIAEILYYKDRLVSRAELLLDGGQRLGSMPEDQQAAIRSAAVVYSQVSP